jgi:hypothetical protein
MVEAAKMRIKFSIRDDDLLHAMGSVANWLTGEYGDLEFESGSSSDR